MAALKKTKSDLPTEVQELLQSAVVDDDRARDLECEVIWVSTWVPGTAIDHNITG